MTVETADWPVYPLSGDSREMGIAPFRLGSYPSYPKGAYFTAVMRNGKIAYLALPLRPIVISSEIATWLMIMVFMALPLSFFGLQALPHIPCPAAGVPRSLRQGRPYGQTT